MNMTNSSARQYILLYANILLYSAALVIAKFAGEYPLFSATALVLYSLSILALGLYAILWQQILKRMPLGVAYPNRAVSIPLGMLWGALFFGEAITLNMVLGVVVIACGIVLMVTRNE